MTYDKQLRHPSWLALRERIAHERDFTCEDCERQFDSLKAFNLHHKYYESDGRFAWQYPDDALKLLCWDCHKLTTAAIKSILMAVGDLDAHEILDLANALQQRLSEVEHTREITNWILFHLQHPEYMR